MNIPATRSLRPFLLASCAVLASIALLASCGGGGVGSGGSGKTDVGFAAGTVNGFGSVIVDGATYDDRNAPVVAEIAPGQDAIAEVKLGQRVSVEYATPGVASLVRVEASVSGPVSAIPASGTALPGSTIVVVGQTVTVNAIGSKGPITQFGGGYSGSVDVRAGDTVEVHGVLVLQGAGYTIQATRVDKLAAPMPFVRATGIVANPGAGAFSLASLAVDAGTATVSPAGSAIVAGQTVTVLAPLASLKTVAGTGVSVKAAEVRVRALPRVALPTLLSGAVSRLDTAARTFALDGQAVGYSAAVVTPAGATLVNGLYVQVLGTIAGDGTLVASSVVVRDAGSDSEAELHGNVSGFDASTSRFTVRGVSVDGTGAILSGCPGTGLADGIFVEVHGATTATGVRARTVQCESESSGSTVERQGTASAVDLAARTFSLTPQGRPALAVSWKDTTFFGGGLTPSTLAGKAVQVEGSIVGTVLVAAKVSLDD